MKKVTLQDFKNKYSSFDTIQYGQSIDVAYKVLGLLAANLSDLHIEKNISSNQDIDNRLNSLKELIFDFQDVIQKETIYK